MYLWFIGRKLENEILDEADEELVVELNDISSASNLDLCLVEELIHWRILRRHRLV